MLAAHVEPAFDSKARRRGLLGRDAVPENYAMIIAPCGSVHTFFMRMPIDVIFVSRDGTVVKTCRSVKPWRIAGALRAFATIEAAAGFIDRTETVPGDVVALREIPQTRRATDAPFPVPVSPAPEGGVPKARHTTPQRRVTLADIVSRKTPIGWFESVAIVQELCEVVLARGPADDPRIPELRHIALTPAGGIGLLAGGPEEHSPVHRASLVLLALTPEADLPLQLRLLALEQVSPTPRFGSLKEFHGELEFFERPNRRDIARGVHERFLRQQAQAPAGGVPPALLEPRFPRRRFRWWKQKSVRVALAALLLVLTAAGVAWEWRRPESEQFRQPVARLTETTEAWARRAAGAARVELAAAQKKLGLTAQEAVPPPPLALAGGRPARTTAQPGVASRAVSQDARTVPAGPPRQPQAAEPPSAAVAKTAPPDAGTREAPALPPKPPDLPAPDMVFTAADPLVIPPQLLRPVLPKAPPPGVRMEDLPEVEVLVSAAGDVEMARLLSPGTAPNPAMTLSAVKAWVFQPAALAGQPVRYRLRMRLPGR